MNHRIPLLIVLAIVTLLLCLPAHAAVVAVVETSAGTINLHDTAGPCFGNARFAEYISVDASVKIGGCYLSNGMAVRVVFLDGDVADIPVNALKKPRST